jgi:hypothetical protein
LKLGSDLERYDIIDGEYSESKKKPIAASERITE